LKATDAGTKRTRLSRGFLRILFILAGTIAGLLIAEQVARLVAPYPMSFPWMDQVNGVLAPLPSVHGRHFVPGVYDTTFSFSPQRFRNQEVYTPEPGPGVLRIAALGASFTFGSGANNVDAYPSQLQKILQQQATRDGWDQTVEVINAGIAGSVAAEQALWYENWVRNFHPDVVILNVACAADHATGLFQIDNEGNVEPRFTGELQVAGSQGLAVRRMVHRVPGFTFLAEHSELFNLFRLAEGEVLRHKRNAALGADTIVSDPTNPANDLLDQELRFETGEVRWLKRQVEASGATLVIVVLPCRENIYPSQSKWAPRIRKEYPMVTDALWKLSLAEGIPFTELTSVFIEKAKGQHPLYYDGKFETHPTPAGYRVIAEAVAQFLVERGVVPQAKSATEGAR
jgi:lysophospholipase L1-like esterase